MTSQLTVFDLSDLAPFQRGSPTSKDAARDFAKRARTIREMVQLYILGCGSKGATYVEVMGALGLCSGTVCARLSELKKTGEIVATVRRRNRCTVNVERRFFGKEPADG